MKSVPKNIYLKTCSTSFTGTQSTSFSILNSLQRVSKVSSCSSTGRWQMPLLFFSSWQMQMLLASANLLLTGKCQFVVDRNKRRLEIKKNKYLPQTHENIEKCRFFPSYIGKQVWKTQQWKQDWKRSVFIPIPKKDNANECSNYCTIALMLAR